MNKQERKDYNREYRREGFGRLADKRYYEKNRMKLIAKAVARKKKRKESTDS